MKHYSLMREDLDNLIELCQWPGQDHPLHSVEPKVKAAFTRQYNKEVILPFASGAVSGGRKRAAAAPEEAWGEEEEEGAAVGDEEEDKDDIEADSMIKAKKATGRGRGGAAAAAAGGGKGKGGGKGASKRAKK